MSSIRRMPLDRFEHKEGEEKQNQQRDEKLIAVLSETDEKGNTLLHYRIADQALLERIAKMNPRATRVAEFKSTILLSAKNNDKRNILHELLSSESPCLLDELTRVINVFGKEAVRTAIHMTDKYHHSPIFTMCRHRKAKQADVLDAMIKQGLIPSIDLFFMKDMNDLDIFYEICARTQDGKDDYKLLELICACVEAELPKEMKAQTNTLTKSACLTEGYDYLKKRARQWNYNKKRAQDYTNRLNDFAACLVNLSTGRAMLPAPPDRFESRIYLRFFHSSERYHAVRKKFWLVSKIEAKNFIEFLTSKAKDDPVAKALVQQINHLTVVLRSNEQLSFSLMLNKD